MLNYGYINGGCFIFEWRVAKLCLYKWRLFYVRMEGIAKLCLYRRKLYNCILEWTVVKLYLYINGGWFMFEWRVTKLRLKIKVYSC